MATPTKIDNPVWPAPPVATGWEPPEPPRRPRTLLWAILCAIAVLGAGAAIVVFVIGGDDPEPKPVTPPRPTATLTQPEVESLLNRYSAAYSAEDVDQLRALFAPGFRRTNDGEPPESRDEALDTYASQFAELESPSYQLRDVRVKMSGVTAEAEGDYSVTSSAGSVTGSISFDVAEVNGTPLITAIATEPSDGTTIPAPEPKPEPRPDEPANEGGYASTVAIKTWYSNYGQTYIHFKAVDESTGKTVAEAEGSDSIDLDEEVDAVERNAAREALVQQLTGKLEADGWTEISPVEGGEWYELRFGR